MVTTIEEDMRNDFRIRRHGSFFIIESRFQTFWSLLFWALRCMSGSRYVWKPMIERTGRYGESVCSFKGRGELAEFSSLQESTEILDSLISEWSFEKVEKEQNLRLKANKELDPKIAVFFIILALVLLWLSRG